MSSLLASLLIFPFSLLPLDIMWNRQEGWKKEGRKERRQKGREGGKERRGGRKEGRERGQGGKGEKESKREKCNIEYIIKLNQEAGFLYPHDSKLPMIT